MAPRGTNSILPVRTCLDAGFSGSDLAEEVARTTRETPNTIPEGEWAVFHGLLASEMGEVLRGLAWRVRLSHYREEPRGPRKPKPRKASGDS